MEVENTTNEISMEKNNEKTQGEDEIEKLANSDKCQMCKTEKHKYKCPGCEVNINNFEFVI